MLLLIFDNLSNLAIGLLKDQLIWHFPMVFLCLNWGTSREHRFLLHRKQASCGAEPFAHYDSVSET
jgi:hypothetical protein